MFNWLITLSFSACIISSIGSEVKRFEEFKLSALSLCGSTTWMDYLKEQYPCLTHFVDVGANKGYTSREFFSMFSEHRVGSGKEWYMKLLDYGLEKHKGGCGSCRDCCEVAVNSSRSQCDSHDIVVWAFEPSKTNFNRIIKIRDEFGLNAVWNIENAAVSNISDNCTYFEDGKDETGSLSAINVSKGPRHCTKVLRLDDYFQSRAIDVVKIDAEGYDWTVILGALELLKSSVKLLYFEYGLGSDPTGGITPRLKTMCNILDSLSFNCYMTGLGGIVSLTGNAWQEEYDIFHQSSYFYIFGKAGVNIYCASRSRASQLVSRYEEVAVGGKNNKTLHDFMAIHREELKTTDHLSDPKKCKFPLPRKPDLQIKDGRVEGKFYGKDKVRKQLRIAANIS